MNATQLVNSGRSFFGTRSTAQDGWGRQRLDYFVQHLRPKAAVGQGSGTGNKLPVPAAIVNEDKKQPPVRLGGGTEIQIQPGSGSGSGNGQNVDPSGIQPGNQNFLDAIMQLQINGQGSNSKLEIDPQGWLPPVPTPTAIDPAGQIQVQGNQINGQPPMPAQWIGDPTGQIQGQGNQINGQPPMPAQWIGDPAGQNNGQGNCIHNVGPMPAQQVSNQGNSQIIANTLRHAIHAVREGKLNHLTNEESNGLDAKLDSAIQNDLQRLRKVSDQVESILAKDLIASMRKLGQMDSSGMAGLASDQFEQNMSDTLGRQRGLGISNALFDQMAQTVGRQTIAKTQMEVQA